MQCMRVSVNEIAAYIDTCCTHTSEQWRRVNQRNRMETALESTTSEPHVCVCVRVYNTIFVARSSTNFGRSDRVQCLQVFFILIWTNKTYDDDNDDDIPTCVSNINCMHCIRTSYSSEVNHWMCVLEKIKTNSCPILIWLFALYIRDVKLNEHTYNVWIVQCYVTRTHVCTLFKFCSKIE